MGLCWDGSPLKSRMELETLDERPRREERSEDEAYDEARDMDGCANCGADEVVMVDDSDTSVGYHDEIPWCVKGNHRED